MSKTANILPKAFYHPALKRLIFSIVFILSVISVYGQTVYPVQVYTQLTPPYTPFLPAYYSGTNEKLKVTLINTDMQQPSLNVYLKMRIQSSAFTIETPENVYTGRMELQAGVPLQLSLNDLAVYFKKDNMLISGGRNEFLRTNMLPDNFYRFNFEVYDATTNRLLSNPKLGFAQAMIAAGDPPILNLPIKGTPIMESNIPSIMFTWTPRHMNSVASAYGTEYEITLVEIYDKQVSPEAAFDYSRVLYTETVRSTSFIHTAAQPMLIPGMRYAWRVRAIARENLENANVFKNNGYSAISWFDYTVDCKLVQYERVEVKDRVAVISWQKTDALGYDVQYRKKGSKKWYAGSLTDNETCPVYNLKFGEEYEYHIGVRCTMNDAFTYTDIKAFRMPEELQKSANCGILPNINVKNQTPTRELQAKLPILVGDFPVFVTKVSGSGRFTGEGYVGIPYLKNAKIAVKFNNIVVNTDNRMIDGFIETKYDISSSGNNLLWDVDETLTGGKGVGDIRTGEEKAQYIVDYTIDSKLTQVPIRKDESKDDIKDTNAAEATSGENDRYIVTLTDEKGNKFEQVVDKFPATIQDKSGATYEVDKDGNIKQVSSKSDIKLDDRTKYTKDNNAVVQFEPIEGVTKYALDVYNEAYKQVAEFEREYVVEEGQEIRASIKFMEAGSSDDIFVKLASSKDGFDPNKVHFITGQQKEYKAVYDADKKGWTLTLVGSDANDGQELFVVYEKEKGRYGTLAVLKVVSYKPQSVDVVLVPVNGVKGSFADIAKVKGELNRIYNKVGITVNVTLGGRFDYTLDKFDITGSGLFSTRTNDMKAIEAAFMQTANYKENQAYLFIMDIKPNSDDNEGAEGDMLRKSQFGYLFRGSTTTTVAHEIGHGLFHLDHPFARANAANSFAKGALRDNLMEYGGGTRLAKLQWDAIHSPGLVIGLFERDRDAMISKYYTKVICVNAAISKALKKNGYVQAVNNKYFKLKDEETILNVVYADKSNYAAPVGSVTEFRDEKTNKIFVASYDTSTGKFISYKEKGINNSDRKDIEYIASDKLGFSYYNVSINKEKCLINIDGTDYPLIDDLCNCHENSGSYKSKYAQSFSDDYDDIEDHQMLEKIAQISSLMDKMDETALVDFLKMCDYENSSASDDPGSLTYSFKNLFRIYKKQQGPTNEKFESAYNRLKSYNDAYLKITQHTKDIKECDELVKLVAQGFTFGEKKQIAKVPFVALTGEQRFYLLDILSKANVVSGRFVVSSDYQPEDIAVAIITTMPSDQINKQLYNSLYDNKELVAKLYEGMDGDNLLPLLGLIVKLSDDYGNKDNINQFIYLGNAQDEEYKKDPFLSGLPFFLTDKSKWSSSNLDLECVIGRANISPLNLGTIENRKTISTISGINPMENILVYVDTKENQTILPAVYAYYLGVKNNREEALKAVNKSVMICAGFISVGTILDPLATNLAKTVATAQLSKLAIDVAMTDKQLIEELNKTENGRWFVKNWPVISILTDIGLASAEIRLALYHNAPELSKTINKFNKKAASEVEELGIAAGKTLDDVAKEVNKSITKPSLPPSNSNRPIGAVTRIPANADHTTIISINAENNAANILSKRGYHIEQNPKVPGLKKPDYKIEGEIFDCYSPTTRNVRNVWSEVKGKIDEGQTNRVVINLENWTGGTLDDLIIQFKTYEIPNLKELILIDKGNNVSNLIIK